MPYNFNNVSNAKAFANAMWYERKVVDEFISTLSATNITVVESLRDAKQALITLQKAGAKGNKIFNTNKRWPLSEDPNDDKIYYTSYDNKFNRLLGSIAAALDGRVISSTREQANITGSNVRGMNENVGEDNGRDQQNAFKHLAELRTQLSSYIEDAVSQWDRTKVEACLPATGNDQQENVQIENVQAAATQQGAGGQNG